MLFKIDDDDDEEEEEEYKASELGGVLKKKQSQKLEMHRIDDSLVGLNKIKQEVEKKNIPLIQEYDLNKDNKTNDLKIELKPNTMVRDY